MATAVVWRASRSRRTELFLLTKERKTTANF